MALLITKLKEILTAEICKSTAHNRDAELCSVDIHAVMTIYAIQHGVTEDVYVDFSTKDAADADV
jgi:hypothetical protein